MSLAQTSETRVRWEYAAVAGILALWVFLLAFKIGVGLIAGLAVFAITRFVRDCYLHLFQKPFFSRVYQSDKAYVKAIFGALPNFLTTTTVVLFVTLVCVGITAALRFTLDNLLVQGPQLIEEAIRSINSVANRLPAEVKAKIPGNAAEFYVILRNATGDIMSYAKNFGGASFLVFLQLVFALILGVSAAVMTRSDHLGVKPLSDTWLAVMQRYVKCFTLLMGAQVYVSMWNTFCTAIFVYIILPFFNVTLPFRELLLIFTALASLIPAAGNVMANTLILILTIRFGVFVAVGSVVYLFVIHKLEYFVNGYIIGKHVRASVPEMLIAIILGEVAFGLPGLITAPVTYAFLKMHWRKWGWV